MTGLQLLPAVLIPCLNANPPTLVGWWRLDQKASGFSGGRPLGIELPQNGRFRLKSDGTYDSEGFVGAGRWKQNGETLVLSPNSDATPAQAFQYAPDLKPPLRPIRMRRVGGTLRLSPVGSGPGGPWIAFVRYEPTAGELARGPRRKPDGLDDLGTPKWVLRRAFLQAIVKGDVAKVRGAIRQGADLTGPPAAVKRAYAFGYTPLALAVWEGHPQVAQALLEAGANPNAKVEGDRTALMLAAWKGDAAAVHILLRFKANRALKSPTGKTALDYARERGHRGVAALLR